MEWIVKIIGEKNQRIKVVFNPLNESIMFYGEARVKIGDNVRGKDVFVIQPTCPPVNDNLMELLTMIDALKRSSAQRITAVLG